MTKEYSLSKSNFIRGLQCYKSLWFHYRQPEIRDEISDNQQAIFDMGHSIGELAQQLFPGGIDVSPEDHKDVAGWLANTKHRIKSGQKVIYEAAFSYNGVFCAADIMVKENNHWKLYEVKGSTSVKQPFINDVALQYYVISGSRIDLTEVAVVHINNQYVRQGALDVKQLFTIVPLLEEIIPMQLFVKEEIQKQKEILSNDLVPDIAIGSQCGDPYPCDFAGHCWQHIPSYSPLNISRLRGNLRADFLNNNILEFSQIPDDCPLSDSQWMQVEGELTGKSHINKPAIRNFLGTINYPVFFMDFETIMPGIPMFDISRPYQQITFQFSVHYLEKPGAELKHFEFLADADLTIDPRIPFIESLLEILNTPGDVLVYNQAFEVSRLREIARDFPQYQNKIIDIIGRIADLATPFRCRDYYVPAMKGSWSIKAVLPALVPNLSYDDLEIHEGGSASLAFLELYYQKDPEIRQATRKNLLEYCGMDTVAMVEILKILNSI
jgi:hypothetical protein